MVLTNKSNHKKDCKRQLLMVFNYTWKYSLLLVMEDQSETICNVKIDPSNFPHPLEDKRKQSPQH